MPFQHRFESIEEYLHHRKPYLLLDEIDEITENSVTTIANLQGNEFWFQGHFPGAPILPGALMQEMTTQTGGILIAANYNPMETFNTEDPFFNEFALGVLVKVKNSRFRGFARPEDQLRITSQIEVQVGEVFEMTGTVTNAKTGDPIMRNRFVLSNIPSKTLQGVSE